MSTHLRSVPSIGRLSSFFIDMTASCSLLHISVCSWQPDARSAFGVRGDTSGASAVRRSPADGFRGHCSDPGEGSPLSTSSWPSKSREPYGSRRWGSCFVADCPPRNLPLRSYPVLHHVPNPQVLDHDRLVLTDETSGQLVQAVPTRVGDSSMDMGDLHLGLGLVRRSLFPAGVGALCLRLAGTVTSFVSGVSDLLAGETEFFGLLPGRQHRRRVVVADPFLSQRPCLRTSRQGHVVHLPHPPERARRFRCLRITRVEAALKCPSLTPSRHLPQVSPQCVTQRAANDIRRTGFRPFSTRAPFLPALVGGVSSEEIR